MMTIDQIRLAVHRLSPQEKAQIISELAADLAQAIPESAPQPYHDFRGVIAHLGPAPSAEDIDEVRREMWANFAEGDDW